jgi:hypothetical protein
MFGFSVAVATGGVAVALVAIGLRIPLKGDFGSWSSYPARRACYVVLSRFLLVLDSGVLTIAPRSRLCLGLSSR